MHKVTWKAQEMTNQRAGVEVKGFAIWGIYRPDAEDPDGPFRAYKSIPGLADGDVTAGSQFVQQLVESIIRSSVANMSIMDVMQKRDAMRDKVKEANKEGAVVDVTKSMKALHTGKSGPSTL